MTLVSHVQQKHRDIALGRALADVFWGIRDIVMVVMMVVMDSGDGGGGGDGWWW